MTERGEKQRSPRRRFRRLRFVLLALGCAVLLLAIAWIFLEKYLQVERYRTTFEAKLAEATGMPVAIGALDLTLRPLPVIRGDAVTWGKDDLSVSAARVFIRPEIRALMRHTVHISEIELVGLKATVPAHLSDLQERIRALMRPAGQEPRKDLQFSVDRIRAEQATLYVGSSERPAFTGDIEVRDVLSPTPSARLTSAVVGTRTPLDVEGEFQLTRGSGGTAVQSFHASASLNGLEFAPPAEEQRQARLAVQVDGKLDEANPQRLVLDLSGNLETGAQGDPFQGPFSAHATWDGTTAHFDDVHWKAAELEFAGEVRRAEDGAYLVSIPSASVGAVALAPVAALLPGVSYRLGVDKDAALAIKEFEASIPHAAPPLLTKGHITLTGIDVYGPKHKLLAGNAEASVVFQDGTIRIEELNGAGLVLTGTVVPDYVAKSAKVDLAGDLNLGSDALRSVVPAERVPVLSGSVVLTRISGTFGTGKGIPADLVLEGSAGSACVGYKTTALEDTLDPLAFTFVSDGKTADIQAHARSRAMGGLEADGRYTFKTRTWAGTLSGDVPRITGVFIKSDVTRERLTALLAAYGQSNCEASFSLPSAQEPRAVLRLERQGDPPVRAELVFPLKPEGGRTLGTFSCNGVVPMPVLADLLPATVHAEGNATVAFVRQWPEAVFRTDVDLANAVISVGDYVRKPEGMPSQVVVTGRAASHDWAAENLTLAVADQTVAGVWRDKRLVFQEAQVDTAKLSGLLAKGGQATGTVRGTVMTSPLEADLFLQDVSFTFNPEATVESINGRISQSQGRLLLDNLVVRGANSTATLSLARKDDAWSGSVQAQQLDVNRVLELRTAARTGPSPGATEPPAAGGGFRGQFTLHADRLLYRRADLTNVSADVLGDGSRIEIRNAMLHPEEGVATGEAVATREGPGAPWVLEGQANLKDASALLLDALLFKEPRGFKGNVDGDLVFSLPLTTDSPPVNRASGSAVLTARNGSFGKMGIATKVLNVLRSTELLWLRMPSLSDEGLTYDKAWIEINMTEGVMTVNRVEVERPSFKLSARGTVDFPKDDMRVDIRVFPLETVTGIAEKVPVLGNVLGEIRNLSPVGLVATGSPYNPTVLPGNVGRGENVLRNVPGPLERLLSP